MKILYLTNSIPKPDNTMNGIFNLRRIEKLKDKKIEVDVISVNNILKRDFSIDFSNNYNLRDLNYSINLEVKVYNDIKLPYIGRVTNVYNRIKNYFIKNDFDLIHAHFVTQGFIASKLKEKYNIPYILTAHGSDIHTMPFESKRLSMKTINALNNADKVIFVSNFLKDKARELGYTKNNFVIIPNGIDKNLLNLDISKKNKERKIVGFVGNLFDVKRAYLLPEIFNEVYKKNNNVKFIIVGDGYLRDLIESKITKYNLENNIELVGRVHPNNVKKYMRKMDIMVLPSKNEGWPCVVLEAKAVGTLVLGSNNGGIPEAINNKNCF